jgi:hypothetical protein
VFCDRCGQPAANEARFCARCGKALTLVAEPAPLISAEPPPRRVSDLATDPAPVAVPGLTAAEDEKLRKFVSGGLLDTCRKRVTGDRRASDRVFLDALTSRAAADPSFHAALGYSMDTIDFLPLERLLDHPERGVPGVIAQWARTRAAAAESTRSESAPGSAGQVDKTPGFLWCPNGHRVRSDKVSCPTCGAAVEPSSSNLATAATGISSAAPPTNGFAIASLVLGIIWLSCVGSVLALIFGYISLRQIRERGEGGRGVAIAGIVLGWLGVALAVILIIVIESAANTATPTYG